MSTETPLAALDAADRHREIAARFSAVVAAVTDWDAPAPVAGWSARDVVGHLAEWFPMMLSGGAEVTLAPLPSVAEDPAATWDALDAQVQDILDDPATAALSHTGEHTGTMPVADVVDRFYTPDVFMHTWDLARAGGRPDRLDPDYATELHQGLSSMEEMIRASGQFGEQQPEPADADATDRLIAFIGRDPRWAPPVG